MTGPVSLPIDRRSLRTSDYDYDLPDDRIARYPAERRDESRLLVVPPGPRAFRHRRFRDVPDLLAPGDVVVVNESRVRPARLLGHKPTGAPAEILLLRPSSGGRAGTDQPDSHLWEALVRPGGKLKPGRRVVISPELEVAILDSTPQGGRVVRLETDLSIERALERYGHVPLPPYLDRDPEPLDRERYQTVYARHPGSVAAPTAGLHFTESLLDEIRRAGVAVVPVTLHVGVGTFRPVEAEDPADHEMHAESYEIRPAAAERIEEARRRGGRVWAVGTTVVRTLETVASENGTIRPGRGTTDLFIRPGHRFRAVDCLVTNFHLPRSTLLMLVCAFAGRERVLAAYDEAVEEGYRFYSYGDAMALFPGTRRP